MKTDQSQMKRPRYMGIPTFMRAPSVDDLSSIDIALIGVPFDGGVTNRPGARHGPREVRNQSSLMRSIHPATRQNPFDRRRIGDFGDVDFPSVFDLEASIDRIHQFYLPIAAAGVIPLTVGGDHSISYPILRALGAGQPLGLIHIDSHTDTWDSFAGSKVMHGAPFRRAVEPGPLIRDARFRSASAALRTPRRVGTTRASTECASSSWMRSKILGSTA